MPRLTKDQWAEARIKWESDPTMAMTALAAEIGVSEAAVRQKAKADSWTKLGSLKSINEVAQRKADAKLRPNFDGEAQKASTRELAEDIRADVIERHRSDWAEHRIHFTTSEIAANFEIGKSAKISSEMLAIRQKGERAAYGLDDTSATETIEIVRSYGGKA